MPLTRSAKKLKAVIQCVIRTVNVCRGAVESAIRGLYHPVPRTVVTDQLRRRTPLRNWYFRYFCNSFCALRNRIGRSLDLLFLAELQHRHLALNVITAIRSEFF